MDVTLMSGAPQEIESKIVRLIGARGPLTGFEVKKEIDVDNLALWRACKASERLEVRALGRRYMRLDRHVDGFARLSPSILREFLTYSVVGLAGEPDLLEKKCDEISTRIRGISRMKLELARQMVADVMDELPDAPSVSERICFIIAGDIVYDMAHDVPRPERSTGMLVRGSDIDLVVVVADDLEEAVIEMLDNLIYYKKHRMLKNPAINEELDYKIKRLGLVRQQADFDDFRRMVAIKILHEGQRLYGGEEIYGALKSIIEERGLPEKLAELEALAQGFRDRAEDAILRDDLTEEEIREMHLFYSAEEFEEFE